MPIEYPSDGDSDQAANQCRDTKKYAERPDTYSEITGHVSNKYSEAVEPGPVRRDRDETKCINCPNGSPTCHAETLRVGVARTDVDGR